MITQKTETKTFALYAGRHELPINRGAIFEGINPEKAEGVFGVGEKVWNEFKDTINKGVDVKLYVTGYTPALIQITDWYGSSLLQDTWAQCISDQESGHPIAPYKSLGNLYLLHYNRDNGNYIEKKYM